MQYRKSRKPARRLAALKGERDRVTVAVLQDRTGQVCVCVCYGCVCKCVCVWKGRLYNII